MFFHLFVFTLSVGTPCQLLFFKMLRHAAQGTLNSATLSLKGNCSTEADSEHEASVNHTILYSLTYIQSFLNRIIFIYTQLTSVKIKLA